MRRGKKKNLFKNSVIEGRRNREKKREERQIEREICGKRRGHRGDSEGVRREKKTKGREEMRDFIVRKAE